MVSVKCVEEESVILDDKKIGSETLDKQLGVSRNYNFLIAYNGYNLTIIYPPMAFNKKLIINTWD